MKLSLRVLALAMALLLPLSALAGCTSANRPLLYLKNSIYETFEESLGGEVTAFLLQALQSGSFSLNFGGTDLVQGLPESADLTVWHSDENQALAAKGSVTLGGTVYSADAWLDDSAAVLTSPAFLGSTTLGVHFGTLEQDLKTSIFSNNSGTAYADPNVSQSSADSVIGMKDALFELLGAFEEYEEISDEIVETFLAYLAQNATNNRYKEQGHTYVSLQVDNDALSRTLRQTRADLIKNRSFCRETKKLAQTLDALNAARNGVVDNEYSTKWEYFLTSEADIDALCLKIDSAAPFVFSMKATVRNFGKALETLDCTYTIDGVQRLQASLLLAEPTEESHLRVTFDGVERELTYRVTKDSMRAFEATMTYKKTTGQGQVLSVAGQLSANRRADTYRLTLTQEDDARSFEGKYSFSDKQLSLSVDSAAHNGEPKKLQLSLVVQRTATAPNAPTYVNLVTIDTTRYAPIDTRARETYATFRASFDALELTPYTALCDLLSALGLEEEIPPKPETVENE